MQGILQIYRIGIDIHSLSRWGSFHDYPLFVRSVPPNDNEIKKLGSLFRQVCENNCDTSAIAYEQIYDIFPYDTWAVERDYKDVFEYMKSPDKPVSSNAASFFTKQGARLGLTFETPYFGTGDNIITHNSAKGLGKDFAKALELYAVN